MWVTSARAFPLSCRSVLDSAPDVPLPCFSGMSVKPYSLGVNLGGRMSLGDGVNFVTVCMVQ